jgi:hypothetical protein
MSFLRPRVPLIPLLNPVGKVWVKVANGIYVKGVFWFKVANGIYQQKTLLVKINGLYR